MSFFKRKNRADEQLILPEKDNLIEDLFTEIKNRVTSGILNEEDLSELSEKIILLEANAKNLNQSDLVNNLKAQSRFANKLADEVLPLGFNKYVLKDDITDIIENKTFEELKPLVMKPLSEFPRPIPDKNALEISKASKVFDDIYILFTDYTGKERKVHEEVQIEKDPIAFGIMHIDLLVNDRTKRFYSDKMVFITDWVDEYCDLTLEKLIENYDVDVFNVGEDSSVTEEF